MVACVVVNDHDSDRFHFTANLNAPSLIGMRRARLRRSFSQADDLMIGRALKQPSDYAAGHEGL
jgi:hypothetical protein